VADVAIVEAVHVRGVDEGHPRVEGGVDGANGVVLRGAIVDREVHPAEADRADGETAAAEGARVHGGEDTAMARGDAPRRESA